ncbi:MAG TPA: MDR family MFS transporter [Terrimesophilobacter sp.]|nr:MDR family MFS transporter [Terrimesophilobacter sp.]
MTSPAAPRTERARVERARSHESTRGLILLFVGLMLAMLLASLSQTVLSAAMPTMVGELNGVDLMLWVMTAYILASTIMMPIYGKLGDLIGRKGLLLFAITAFMAGSVLGGLAGDMNLLIIARVVQGIGGGGLMILSQAIIADVVPARERGKYMGVMGAVFAVSSVAGPLLGGWFTEGIGWRWTFWINIPLGILALAASIAFLHLPQHDTSVKPRIDVFGMALLAAATTCLVLITSWGGSTYDWDSLQILLLAAGTVVTGILFVVVELHTPEPIIPMNLFRERNFTLTTLAGLLTGVAMFGVIGYLPTYLQMTFGQDATIAGLLMIPMMGALLVTSVVTGWLVSRYGRYKWMPIAGSVLVAIGLALLSSMTPETPLWLFCGYLAVMGMGLGTSMQILVLIVQNTFHVRMVGTATAANNYFRQIGATLGSAFVGSLFATRLFDLLAERLPASGTLPGGSAHSLTPDAVKHLPDAIRVVIDQAYNDALTPLFLWMVPLALAAFVLLCFIKEVPLATTIDRDAVLENSVAEGNLLVTADEGSSGPATLSGRE